VFKKLNIYHEGHEEHEENYVIFPVFSNSFVNFVFFVVKKAFRARSSSSWAHIIAQYWNEVSEWSVNLRGTEPYAQWCEKLGEKAPRLLDSIIRKNLFLCNCFGIE